MPILLGQIGDVIGFPVGVFLFLVLFVVVVLIVIAIGFWRKPRAKG